MVKSSCYRDKKLSFDSAQDDVTLSGVEVLSTLKFLYLKKSRTRNHLVSAICFLFITFLFNGSLISIENEKNNIDVTSSVLSLSSEHTNKNEITKFDGESFKYNIGFWVFKKMGTATLQCNVEHDDVTVTLDAYTTGLFDKLLHRHNNYKVTMVLDNDTKRLKPLVSHEKKIKGEKERVKITNYDYVNEICQFKTLKNGKVHREKEVKLDKNVSDDAISAFYNLRNEIYGEVKEGSNFNIRTAYRDRTTESSIFVRLPEKSDKISRWNDVALKASFAADITMDPEIFNSEEGKQVILFTGNLQPIGFIAKDVIGFGDLYGVLEEEIN